jgi:hypothetical protein
MAMRSEELLIRNSSLQEENAILRSRLECAEKRIATLEGELETTQTGRGETLLPSVSFNVATQREGVTFLELTVPSFHQVRLILVQA